MQSFMTARSRCFLLISILVAWGLLFSLPSAAQEKKNLETKSLSTVLVEGADSLEKDIAAGKADAEVLQQQIKKAETETQNLGAQIATLKARQASGELQIKQAQEVLDRFSQQDAQVEAQILTLNQQFSQAGTKPPDIWLFDFFGQAYPTNTAMWNQVIGWIHSQGQMATGNINGESDPTNAIPPRLDFVSTNDRNFQLNITAIGAYRAQGFRVLLSLNNNPQNAPDTESCEFMGAAGTVPSYTARQRLSYVTLLAQEQSQYGFSLGYPVFFPICPARVAYDSVADGAVGPMVALMNQYGG
jgi:hypothetical protein